MNSKASGFPSMRARMTGLFAVFTALLMLLGGAAVERREERREERRNREILTVAVERARDEVAEKGPRRPLLSTVQATAGEIAAGGLVLLITEGNRVLWKTHEVAPDWPAVSGDWRFETMTHGRQTLVIARDWKPAAEHLRETGYELWQLGFLVVAATTIGAWFLVGNTLSPLYRLAAQAQNASTESLQVRLESPSSDAEMRYLTATLNELLSRLEKEAQARGRFYAAASHELRTPIQVLIGQLDVARSRPRSNEEYQATLAEVHSHTERLARLVQDLLQLNALEMRQSVTPQEELDLADWVERALDQQATAIAASGLAVETALEDTPLLAPSAHLEMLLRNLLENAVKYATPGSALKIRVSRAPDGVEFTVWNACLLAANEDLTLWFEPFYRPDAARNSETGGNGLGLSIVAALARSNRWDVQLRQEAGGVLAVVLFGAG